MLRGTTELKRKKTSALALRPRLRIVCGEAIALGPGKVDLLSLVAQTGSIRVAAERMGMSYMRAWTLVRTMNACFKKPLIIAARGGRSRGGSRLTDTGRKALAAYHQMEADCLKATQRKWKLLKRLMRG